MPERTRPSRAESAPTTTASPDDELAVLNELKGVLNRLDDALARRVAGLEAEVAALTDRFERQTASLIAEALTEICTRRLVIVDEAGNPRIIAEVSGSTHPMAHVIVGNGCPTNVQIDAGTDDNEMATVLLSGGGETMAIFGVTDVDEDDEDDLKMVER